MILTKKKSERNMHISVLQGAKHTSQTVPYHNTECETERTAGCPVIHLKPNPSNFVLSEMVQFLCSWKHALARAAQSYEVTCHAWWMLRTSWSYMAVKAPLCLAHLCTDRHNASLLQSLWGYCHCLCFAYVAWNYADKYPDRTDINLMD